MNICLISRGYPPETGGGGIGTYTYNLAHGLTELGHSVHVISYTDDDEKNYTDDKICVHRISINKLEKRGSYRINKYIPLYILLRSYKYAKKLRELIDKHNIDIVEAPNGSAHGFWFCLMRRGIPLVTRLYTPYFIDLLIENKKRSLRDHSICWLEKFSVLRSCALVTSTYSSREEMAKAYRINKEKIKVLPLGMELPDKSEDNNRKKATNGYLRVLFVGRFEKRKGIYLLFDAIPEVLKNVPKVEFCLVGRDSSNLFNNYFLKKYPEFKDRVKVIGFIPHAEIKQYYRDCDLFVAPSRYESFGLIYIEAMSCKKPVVALDDGSAREIILNGNTGVLVKLNENGALAREIIKLLNNEPLRKEMGANAYKRFTQYFTREKIAENAVEFYQRIINAHNFKNNCPHVKSKRN